MASKPWIDGSNAGIARELRNDSEALRYAEWWVRRKIYGFEDAELRWLRDEFVKAYKEIVERVAYERDESKMGWSARELAQIEREIDAILDALFQSQSNRLNDALPAGWQMGYYGRAWLLDNVTAQDWNASKNVLLPAEAIRAAVVSPYIGTDGWLSLKREALVDGVKRSMIQGLIQGEGMDQIRQRLARELGVKPGQTKNFKQSMYRCLLITRTEIIRASNLGTLSIYEDNADVLRGWEWVATLDERTCSICGGLDGNTFEFGSSQLLPPSGSHPGCRCTSAPWLRYADLLDPQLTRPREIYADWAARNGIAFDGGLAGQRASDAHGLNKTAA
jgi:SPP1 gp7 family putative phage head morphogenesis protein